LIAFRFDFWGLDLWKKKKRGHKNTLACALVKRVSNICPSFSCWPYLPKFYHQRQKVRFSADHHSHPKKRTDNKVLLNLSIVFLPFICPGGNEMADVHNFFLTNIYIWTGYIYIYISCLSTDGFHTTFSKTTLKAPTRFIRSEQAFMDASTTKKKRCNLPHVYSTGYCRHTAK
jgi:hypothetical protein